MAERSQNILTFWYALLMAWITHKTICFSLVCIPKKYHILTEPVKHNVISPHFIAHVSLFMVIENCVAEAVYWLIFIIQRLTDTKKWFKEQLNLFSAWFLCYVVEYKYVNGLHFPMFPYIEIGLWFCLMMSSGGDLNSVIWRSFGGAGRPRLPLP